MSRALLPFVAAGIVALLCTPLIERVRLRTGWPRSLIAWITFVVLLCSAGLLGWLLLPPLFHDVLRVGTDLQGATRRLLTALHVTVDPDRLATQIVERLRSTLGSDPLLAFGAFSIGGLFGTLLFWTVLAYFLADEPRISAGLLWLVPPAKRAFALRVWGDLAPTLRRYFAGVAIVVVYASVAAYLGLGWLLGLHHALLLALLTGFLELIPLIGPLVSALVAGLIAIGQSSDASRLIAYIGYAVALRVSIDQLVGPLVLGRAGRVSPVLVILCFLTGAVLFGVTGVILAVPVALALRTALAVKYDRSGSCSTS